MAADDLLGVHDWQERDGFGPTGPAVPAATHDLMRDGAVSAESWAACERELHSEKTVLIELKSPKRPKPAGLLAASSDAAYAVGRQRDPHHCDHGYQDLPLVSSPPVVQPLH